MMETINLNKKFESFDTTWDPKIIAALNGQQVKLAKLSGSLVWHSHADEDELFLVVKGTLFMKVRDREQVINPWELIVVPKGVEHFPYTRDTEQVWVLLFEPASTKHTGEVETDRTVHNQEWI